MPKAKIRIVMVEEEAQIISHLASRISPSLMLEKIDYRCFIRDSYNTIDTVLARPLSSDMKHAFICIVKAFWSFTASHALW